MKNIKQKNMIARHGDLLIRQIDKLPGGLKIKSGNVLAEGETTGHKHQLVAERQNAVQLFEDDKGRLYFKLDAKAELQHQEHKTITFQPGIYVVGNEREYDPFLEEIKKVAD